MIGRLIAALAIALSVAVSGVGVASAATAPAAVTVYVGTINGANYLVEVPQNWNGTLLLWSHAAYLFGFQGPPAVELANRPETERWALDHGYALAASEFNAPNGWVVDEALADQMLLLDWFAQHVGKPTHTIAWGTSMGGLVSVLLAERHPDRFDGVWVLGGGLAGSVATWNLGLDLTFAFRTLIAPSLQLVDISNPAANAGAAQQALHSALATPQGRARIALANAMADVPGWSLTFSTRPTDLAGIIQQQATYDGVLLQLFLGSDRVNLEQRAGGNPSWNVGVDYAHQLAISSQRTVVEQAYQAAGLDLPADVAALNAAPRIAADPRAVAFQALFGTPLGLTPFPVVTVDNVGDGFTPPEHTAQYDSLVALFGDPGMVRNLFINRGGHTTTDAGEEIVALRTLIDRVTSGSWDDTSPAALDAAAAALCPAYDCGQTKDWLSGQFAESPPAFTDFTPGQFPRPFPDIQS